MDLVRVFFHLLLPSLPLLFASFSFGLNQPALAADVARGQYIVEALAACDNCHTPRGPEGYVVESRFSGGSQTFTDKTYTVRGSNITPDTQTGIGAWTDAQLRAAIVDGVGPTGPLAPVMPSDSYKALTQSDLDAIVAYLRSAAPVNSPPSLAAPRDSGGWARRPLPGAQIPFGDAALEEKTKRGLYIASLARCMACHSGETNEIPDHDNRLGAGGKIFRSANGVAVASNITPHLTRGVGAWSDDELKRAITQGVSRDGRPLKPTMANLSKAHFSKMTPDDLEALVAWLKTIPPRE